MHLTEKDFDSAIDYATVMTTLDGRVTSWSEGATRIIGCTESERLGGLYMPTAITLAQLATIESSPINAAIRPFSAEL